MPSTFTDRLGRSWDLTLTLGVIGKVRKQLGINLGTILSDSTQVASLLNGDVEKLGQVIYAIVESQVKKAGLDDESFLEGFDGETVLRCSEALAEAIVSFSHPQKKIADAMIDGLRKMLGKYEDVVTQVVKAETERNLSILNSTDMNSVA